MTLYEFFGDGCPHCENMSSKVERLEEEEDVKVEKLEVWDNKENADKMQEFDDGKCGGVPFFFNTESEEWICGETDFENLRNWAMGNEVQ